eukprot:1160563-Pelagomonas_calceolata.AAC.3
MAQPMLEEGFKIHGHGTANAGSSWATAPPGCVYPNSHVRPYHPTHPLLTPQPPALNAPSYKVPLAKHCRQGKQCSGTFTFPKASSNDPFSLMVKGFRVD